MQLQVHVRLGLTFLLYWNLLTHLPQVCTIVLWFITLSVVVALVVAVLTFIEGLCGVNDNTDWMTTVVFFDCYVVTSLVLPILLVFISDVRTVLSWRDALLVPVILSLFASYIKRQVALWGQRRDWVFRVVSSVMCCSVTLSAILQWAFYATAEPPSDGPGELAYYVVIVQCATISLHVIKLSLFNLLHVWYTSALTSQLRGSSDFDTMEEVGLCLHIITSTATLLASVMYIPGDVTPLVQLMVVPHICYIAGTLLLIYRLNNILKPFPEVSTTSDCVICLESVKPMEMGRRLECGHIFHSRCLRRWLMRSERCPTCRTPAFRQQNRVDLTFSASINWNTGIRVEENNETHVLRRPQMPISHEIGVQTAPVSGHDHGPLQRLAIPYSAARPSNPGAYGMIVPGSGNGDMNGAGTGASLVSRALVPCATRLPNSLPHVTAGNLESVDAVQPVTGAAVPSGETDEFADKPIDARPGRSLRKRRKEAVEENLGNIGIRTKDIGRVASAINGRRGGTAKNNRPPLRRRRTE